MDLYILGLIGATCLFMIMFYLMFDEHQNTKENEINETNTGIKPNLKENVNMGYRVMVLPDASRGMVEIPIIGDEKGMQIYLNSPEKVANYLPDGFKAKPSAFGPYHYYEFSAVRIKIDSSYRENHIILRIALNNLKNAETSESYNNILEFLENNLKEENLNNFERFLKNDILIETRNRIDKIQSNSKTKKNRQPHPARKT